VKADCKCVLVPVIVDLIVEPKRLPLFPFEKYDGPVEKTKDEFISFEVVPGTQTVKVMPNGGYITIPPEASEESFEFETIEKSVVRFLLNVKDGQKLRVMVNGHPSSIRFVFDTTGLKELLDQAGLKSVSRQMPIKR
jgi:hypothetical protein